MLCSFTQTHTTVQQPLVRDNPCRPVPEETLTHSHPSWSSDILYHLPPFTMVNGILFVHFTCLTLVQPLSRSCLVFLLVLDPQLHTPYLSSPNHHLLFAAHAHTNAACSAAIPMLCYLYVVSLSTPYLGVCLLALRHTSTWPFSSLLAKVPPRFLSLQARSHFHATWCFAHNYCTTFLS